MKNIMRELVKLCLVTLYWAFPLVLVKWSGSYHFLWFFVLSILATIGTFSHYEDLERIDNFVDEEDE